MATVIDRPDTFMVPYIDPWTIETTVETVVTDPVPPETITVTVTMDNILNGTREDPHHCAISMALRESSWDWSDGTDNVETMSSHSIHIYHLGVTYRYMVMDPDDGSRVNQFISLFDNWHDECVKGCEAPVWNDDIYNYEFPERCEDEDHHKPRPQPFTFTMTRQ
jgi:hypothetical protein